MNLGFQEFVLQRNPCLEIGLHGCATMLVDIHTQMAKQEASSTYVVQVISAHEFFSIKAPIPNIFFSNSSPTTSNVTAVVDALMAVGFSCSKQTMKRGITILASYLVAS